jgi:hypothetical protein
MVSEYELLKFMVEAHNSTYACMNPENILNEGKLKFENGPLHYSNIIDFSPKNPLVFVMNESVMEGNSIILKSLSKGEIVQPQVSKYKINVKSIFPFLMNVLPRSGVANPFKGPRNFEHGEKVRDANGSVLELSLRYAHIPEKEHIKNFGGKEIIYFKKGHLSSRLYEGTYFGTSFL